MGSRLSIAYDDADRLVSVTDAARHMTQYAYDDENNLSSVTDDNNHGSSTDDASHAQNKMPAGMRVPRC